LVRQPLVANAGYLWGVQIVSGIVGFAFWGLATRLYRPEDVGTSSAIISAAQLLAGIAGLGVGQGLVRFLPESAFPGRLLNDVFSFNALVSILIAVAYLAGLRIWSPSLALLIQNAAYAVGFALYVMATSLSSVAQMAFVARRRSDFALAQMCIAQGGRIVFLPVLVGLGAAGLVSSVAVPLLLAVTLSMTAFLPEIQPGYRPRLHVSRTVLQVLPYALGNYLAVLMSQSVQMIVPLVALEALGAASSGYAYVGWMIGMLLVSPGLALANSAFAEGSHAPSLLRPILIRAARLGLAVTAPAALLVGILAPWLLAVFFGSAYVPETAPLLRWLAGAAPMTVLSGLYFTYLRVEKRVAELVVLGTLVAAITLGVSVLGMPVYGIAASGLGWLVANSTTVIVGTAMVLWRREYAAQPGADDSALAGAYRATQTLTASDVHGDRE
jgi:O-antigen/teichoic acid export membrane protein